MMQLLWIGLGLVLGFAVISLDTDIYEVGAPLFYGAMMLLLMVTIVIAPDIKGSRSWLVLGPVRLQPAEFAKVATALTLAWLCNQYDFKIESIRSYLKIFAIIFFPIAHPPAAGDGLGARLPRPLPCALPRRLLGALHGAQCLGSGVLHRGARLGGHAMVECYGRGPLLRLERYPLLHRRLYTVYTHDWRNRWRYLLYAVGAVLGVYLIAGVVNFFVAFNLAYVAVASSSSP